MLSTSARTASFRNKKTPLSLEFGMGYVAEHGTPQICKSHQNKTHQNISKPTSKLDLRVSRLHQVAEKLPSPGRFFHGFLEKQERLPRLQVVNCSVNAPYWPMLSIEVLSILPPTQLPSPAYLELLPPSSPPCGEFVNQH